jgi:hypothetical protein
MVRAAGHIKAVNEMMSAIADRIPPIERKASLQDMDLAAVTTKVRAGKLMTRLLADCLKSLGAALDKFGRRLEAFARRDEE